MSNNIRNFTAETAVSPYRILKFGTVDGLVKHAAASTDNLIGISTEVSAEAGTRTDVIYTGPAKVEAGGVITKGDPITSDSNGKAIKADKATSPNAVVVGQAFDSAVSGDIIDVVITRSMLGNILANQPASVATTAAGAVTDLNLLLANLKTAGAMTADT